QRQAGKREVAQSEHWQRRSENAAIVEPRRMDGDVGAESFGLTHKGRRLLEETAVEREPAAVCAPVIRCQDPPGLAGDGVQECWDALEQSRQSHPEGVAQRAAAVNHLTPAPKVMQRNTAELFRTEQR